MAGRIRIELERLRVGSVVGRSHLGAEVAPDAIDSEAPVLASLTDHDVTACDVGAQDRVRLVVATQPFDLSGSTVESTACIGVAEVIPGENAASVVSRADEALYSAEAAGRDSVPAPDGSESVPVDESHDTARGRDGKRPVPL